MSTQRRIERRFPASSLLGLGLMALGPAAAPARAQCEIAELVPGSAATDFGARAATDGNVAVIGARTQVFVFERRPAGWVETQEFSHYVDGAFRPKSVAVQGDRIAVGNPDDSSYENIGEVEIYERVGSSWVLRNALGFAPFVLDHLGWDVDLDGDFVAGGADSTLGKNVWFFELLPGGGFQGDILGLDEFNWVGVSDEFGKAVAIDPEWYAVGAVDAGPTGRVFMYRRVAGDWVADQHVAPEGPPEAGLGFGASLDLEAGRLFVGTGQGAPRRLYVFELVGSLWTQVQVLELPEGSGIGSEPQEVDAAAGHVLTGTQGVGSVDGAGWHFERGVSGWELVSKFAPALPPNVFTCRANALSPVAAVLTGNGRAFVFDVSQGRSRNYCQATPNSTGAPCGLTHERSTSLSRNAFDLAASDAPPGRPGLFFYGTAATEIPFGNGYLCAAGALSRLGPPVQIGAGGRIERPVDFTSPPANTIGPGDSRYFQFWFRDPSAGGALFDLSDGHAVEFCP